jgi:hypothetical protein
MERGQAGQAAALPPFPKRLFSTKSGYSSLAFQENMMRMRKAEREGQRGEENPRKPEERGRQSELSHFRRGHGRRGT